jgi:hypothetical protein
VDTRCGDYPLKMLWILYFVYAFIVCFVIFIEFFEFSSIYNANSHCGKMVYIVSPSTELKNMNHCFWLGFSFFFNFYFIHMCIQCLGHFSPLPPPPPLTSPNSLPPPHPLATWQRLFCPYL